MTWIFPASTATPTAARGSFIGARSRQRSLAGSYSSLRGTALPATPPPSANSLSPTAAAATSPRTAGIGAFCVHVPGGVCDCAAVPSAAAVTGGEGHRQRDDTTTHANLQSFRAPRAVE